ncbi:hypothetical protein BGX20_005898 [Mortierella sp. AD010]|nr:hypothetical protein BGX20_005898 [Mortierella sp. AD010]
MIVSILTTIPLPTPSSLKPPHSNAINVLLNFPIPSSTHLITRSQQEALLDVLTKILDETLKNSLNTDEEASADRLGLDSVAELDEVIPPLVIVLTNIASAGGEGRVALKAKLLPDDIDRSEPLEKGDSFTSRLIRRVTSIRFLHVRETVCQLLFVLCNEDPGVFTRYIGYGNAAGFLLNRGLGVPSSVTGAQVEEIDEEDEAETPSSTLPTPAATSSTPSAPSPALDSSSGSSTAQEINPITGAYYQDASAFRAAMAAMSEEEKEEEAGKLLDMFDRMRRTGVMDIRNPALEAGLRERERDQYYEEQERKEQEEEEELERIYGKV